MLWASIRKWSFTKCFCVYTRVTKGRMQIIIVLLECNVEGNFLALHTSLAAAFWFFCLFVPVPNMPALTQCRKAFPSSCMQVQDLGSPWTNAQFIYLHEIFLLAPGESPLLACCLSYFIVYVSSSIGGESLAVAQNAYAVKWFSGRELNMVFGLQLSFSRVVCM